MKPAKPSPKPAELKSGLAKNPRISRLLLGFICFIAGAAIMVIEISANRLLAPSFGNSLYTWTALIGVILIAFSVGGYLGGVLADKMGRVDLLGWLLAGAAALTMLIPFLSPGLAASLSDSGLISGPLFCSLFLFALPGIMLGAVSPASVRFYSLSDQDHHIGSSAGIISMLGSLGSFVGTFLSGFFLLSAFGVKAIFIGTGVVLLMLALLAFWMARQSLKVQASATGAVLAAAWLGLSTEAKAGEDVIFTQPSFYHQIEVRQSKDGVNRYLQLDSTMEGGMDSRNGDLILNYQRFWQLARLNENSKLKRALFIGAGAFGMPEQVARIGADVRVDVVEIDPAVIETGRRFFKLDEFPNVQPHAGDARRYLQHTEQKYDLIFGDAYNGVRHIPAHLVTREFFAQVRSHLTDDGVFLMNVISAVEGERAVLLGHVLGTLRAEFPNVEIFAVDGTRSDSQNIILLASMKSWKPWLEDRFYVEGSWQSQLVSRRIPTNMQPAPLAVLTDDWNPIDAIIARQLLH